jgi:hypothetical protein
MMATPLVIWLDGKEMSISADRPVIVGRAAEAEIRSDNPLVSRRHATLVPTQGGWLLEDLGSKRGTHVNGGKVDRLVITEPTEVRLGDPTNGSLMRVLPSPQQADSGAESREGEPLSSPVRLALATALVMVVAVLTNRVLRLFDQEGDMNQLLAQIGFSWLAAVPKVDEMLANVRLPKRSGHATQSVAIAEEHMPAYKAVALSGMVLFAVIFFCNLVVMTIYFVLNPEADVETVSLIAGGTAIVLAGPLAVYAIGRRLGERFPDRAVMLLFASTNVAVVLLTLVTAFAAPAEELEAGGGLVELVFILAIVWNTVTLIAGTHGVRRARRRAIASRSAAAQP